MPTRDRVSLGILAGGRGSRLGGADKAFVEVGGIALLERVLDAAGQGYVDILVSHNRSEEPRRSAWQASGVRFVADATAAGEGPLAGLDSLLQAARGEWLLSLPVDLADPWPALADALLSHEGAVVRDADGLQPLVALWPVAEARRAVRQALEAGERAAHALVVRVGLREIDFAPRRLGNLNTPADLRQPR